MLTTAYYPNGNISWKTLWKTRNVPERDTDLKMVWLSEGSPPIPHARNPPRALAIPYNTRVGMCVGVGSVPCGYDARSNHGLRAVFRAV